MLTIVTGHEPWYTRSFPQRKATLNVTDHDQNHQRP